MLGHSYSTTLLGVEASLINVETQINGVLKKFAMIGQADSVLKESKERVRCALEHSGFSFPYGDVVISLTPATLPKFGSGFDLAIALSLLAAQGIVNTARLQKFIVIGELALDGKIKAVRGVMAAACLVREYQGLELLLSENNYKQIRKMPGVKAWGLKNLFQAVAFINQEIELESIEDEEEIIEKNEEAENFSDVVGQNTAKRALEIAAAGGHNLLMVGPPGSGKSMIAKRALSILPVLSFEEQIEVIKIYEAQQHLINKPAALNYQSKIRPFRAPHHSTSSAGLIGGGSIPLPGEISLAHKGVLFLDEFTELRREVIESLRQPLENKNIVVSRAKMRILFPADFILIAAMNPCPCGKKGIGPGSCTCSAQSINKYLAKLSGPILDRIDLQVWVPQLKPHELKNKDSVDQTAEMKKRVSLAREIQKKRFNLAGRCNASFSVAEINKFCRLHLPAEKMLIAATERFKFSARAYHRILKVSRTIADLEGVEQIKEEHLCEALGFRMAVGGE